MEYFTEQSQAHLPVRAENTIPLVISSCLVSYLSSNWQDSAGSGTIPSAKKV